MSFCALEISVNIFRVFASVLPGYYYFLVSFYFSSASKPFVTGGVVARLQVLQDYKIYISILLLIIVSPSRSCSELMSSCVLKISANVCRILALSL